MRQTSIENLKTDELQWVLTQIQEREDKETEELLKSLDKAQADAEEAARKATESPDRTLIIPAKPTT